MARILLVDDERDLVLIYTKLLKMKGHEILDVATNGKEAIDKFTQFPAKVDIIIMDYRLPVIDGLEAMTRILQLNPKVKVLMVSAERGIEQEAMNSGAFAFFAKPISIRKILSEINRIQKIPH